MWGWWFGGGEKPVDVLLIFYPFFDWIFGVSLTKFFQVVLDAGKSPPAEPHTQASFCFFLLPLSR